MTHLDPTSHPHPTTRRPRGPEHGQATAEYAVGTVGAVGIALLLDQLVADGYLLELIRMILERAFSFPWGDLLDGKPFTPLKTT